METRAVLLAIAAAALRPLLILRLRLAAVAFMLSLRVRLLRVVLLMVAVCVVGDLQVVAVLEDVHARSSLQILISCPCLRRLCPSSLPFLLQRRLLLRLLLRPRLKVMFLPSVTDLTHAEIERRRQIWLGK
jgi:hypothetical protein